MNHEDCSDILKEGGYTNIRPFPRSGQRQAFLVNHPTFGNQDIVVKIGTYQYSEDLERIKREAMVLKEIESVYYPKNYSLRVIHPNIFIVEEEYIAAPALEDCFVQFQEPLEILSLLKELVVALNVLWGKEIVHRDVNPRNILIVDRAPRIIDLACARLLNEKTLSDIRGAPFHPYYGAPEQRNYCKEAIGYRTDQYALGIIMLLLLLGEHPFHPNLVGGIAIPQNVIDDNWCKDDPRIEPVRQLALKLLGKQPYMRYRKVGDLFKAINQCIEELQ